MSFLNLFTALVSSVFSFALDNPSLSWRVESETICENRYSQTVELIFYATIQEGYLLYATQQPDSLCRPTTSKPLSYYITPLNHLTDVVCPKAVYDDVLSKSVSTYTGSAALKQRCIVSKPYGDDALNIVLTYKLCTEYSCMEKKDTVSIRTILATRQGNQ